MSKEDIKKQIRNAFDHRVAVRVYSDQLISKEDMDFILDTAWLSPSSVGLEGWRFIVVDKKHIPELSAAVKDIAWGAQPQLETASHFVLLVAEKNARYDSKSIKDSLVRRGLTEQSDLDSRIALYQAFQTRDMQMVDNPRALWDWTAKQTYIAMGNMMTSAAMIGIDSCPIEGFNHAVLNERLAELGWIDIEKEAVATMISFGYRLKDPKHPRSRKPREEVVTWLAS